jgi:hypothetical protein
MEQLLLVSKNVQGAVGNGGSRDPGIDAYGAYVLFSSAADNLIEGDGNGVSDIYLYYIGFDYPARVSLSVDGELEKPSYRPAMDANGVQVLYEHGDAGARTIVVGDPLQSYLGARVPSSDAVGDDHHHAGISPSGRYATWIGEPGDTCSIIVQDRVDGVSWGETCPFGDGVERIDPPWFDAEDQVILWRVSYQNSGIVEYVLDYGDAD